MDAVSGSASKRKRAAGLDASQTPYDDELDTIDDDETHTPKRAKSIAPRVGSATSDDRRTRSVRRKKGVRNLSNLNLRHAAEEENGEDTPRMSKFQEGSLNDKPSMSPPSMYTRFSRTDGGSGQQIDTLMGDYHVSNIVDERGEQSQDSAGESSEPAPVRREGPKSMFKFGKSLTRFYPFALWNKIYDEQHERLLQENIAKAKLKEQMEIKAEAEARYAEMKRTGQFDSTFLSIQRIPGETSTPHDSVLDMNHDSALNSHQRNISAESENAGSHDYSTDYDENEFPATEQKPLRHSVSRFSLRKPSFSNFKTSLKRVASDFNLGQYSKQELLSSVSPEKIDHNVTELETPASRFDRSSSRADRLFRRVSDLERQLQIARDQLGKALDAASPVPNSSTRSRNFTPSGHRNRKWVPGGLPTLPSERLLFPESIDPPGFEDESKTSIIKDVAEASQVNKAENAARDTPPMPAHESAFVEEGSPQEMLGEVSAKDTSQDELAYQSDLEGASGEVSVMEFAEVTTIDNNQSSLPEAKSAALDEKLKQIDAQAKVVRKAATSKKRKSGVGEEDKSYRPGAEDDDDTEVEGMTQKPKKRVKSSGKAGATKIQPSPAKSKVVKLKNASKLVTRANHGKDDSSVVTTDEDELAEEHHQYNSNSSDVESAVHVLGHTGGEPQDHGLDPVYEEEEETTTIPLKEEPSMPTATATPARFSSPKSFGTKRPSDIANVIRTGEVAQKRHRGRTTNSALDGTIVDEPFIALPGDIAMPKDLNGAPGSFENLDDLAESEMDVKSLHAKKVTLSKKNAKDRNENFQWPEDVF